ncbi:MAG: tRNA methyl transferase PRC-barrel domain-containing protein, partial [Pseudomonadota bacterium]
YVRFPLGDLPKTQVRELADHFALPVAAKPDSQDICFVPEGSYANVVEKLRPGSGRGGEIVHLDGRVLGQHEGVIHYTIGQRRGLGVATGEPLFVVKIDAPARQVIVGPREALLTSGLTMEELNWLGDGTLHDACARGEPVLVRVRSTREPAPGKLGFHDEAPAVWFDAPEEGVARGQASVLYDADGSTRILGGGFIASTIAADERLR